MLVNAHDFPWPALVQGIGLIVVSIWAVWYSSRPPKSAAEYREERELRARAERQAAEIAAHNKRVQNL